MNLGYNLITKYFISKIPLPKGLLRKLSRTIMLENLEYKLTIPNNYANEILKFMS